MCAAPATARLSDSVPTRLLTAGRRARRHATWPSRSARPYGVGLGEPRVRRLDACAVGPHAAIGVVSVHPPTLYEPGSKQQLERFVTGASRNVRSNTDDWRARVRVGLDRARHELQDLPRSGVGAGGRHARGFSRWGRVCVDTLVMLLVDPDESAVPGRVDDRTSTQRAIRAGSDRAASASGRGQLAARRSKRLNSVSLTRCEHRESDGPRDLDQD